MTTGTSSKAELSLEQALTELEKLTGSEEHFDGLKSTCRSLASTWLLATFGALGFLLTEDLRGSIPTEVIALALGVAGATGIFLLWILDLLVYHRLLDASFVEGLKLETAFPQAPQVRHRMVASQPGGQTPFYEVWFYIGGISAPVVFSGVLFVQWCWGHGPGAAAIAIAVLVAGLAGVIRFMRKMSPNPVVPQVLPASV